MCKESSNILAFRKQRINAIGLFERSTRNAFRIFKDARVRGVYNVKFNVYIGFHGIHGVNDVFVSIACKRFFGVEKYIRKRCVIYLLLQRYRGDDGAVIEIIERGEESV